MKAKATFTKMSLWFFMYTVFTSALALDMTLTTETGVKIILRDNGKWEYKNPAQAPAKKKDFKVTLDDNRVVLVGADGSWTFADKNLTKYDDIRLDSIRIVGNAQHIDVFTAKQKAEQQALQKTAQKLKSSIPNRKMPINKLQQCIKEVEKEVNSDENFTTGKGWDARVEIKLDRGSILAIVACVEESADSSTQKSTKTSTKDSRPELSAERSYQNDISPPSQIGGE